MGLGILTKTCYLDEDNEEETDVPSNGSDASHSTWDFAPDGTRFNPDDCWEVLTKHKYRLMSAKIYTKSDNLFSGWFWTLS